jgi:6-phosphogluconolactonase (cycloisomerase 2 family)
VLTEYSLSGGTIGALVGTPIVLTLPTNPTDIVVPTGVNVLANNNAVYVSSYDQSAYNPGCTPVATCITSTANPGWVFGYIVGTGGALSGAPDSPYKAGVKPSALVSDPTSRFVYVTDSASNELIGYTIQGGSTLDFLINGPFKTGNEPDAVVIDPRGIYLYVTNGLDSTVSAYVISLGTGTPTAVVNTTGSTINQTDTTPVALVVDPALGRYVYTANQQGNSVSGFQLNPPTGSLQPTVSGPYPSGNKPTALAAVPHGNHALQVTSP